MASDNLSPEDVREILKSKRSEAVKVINMNLGLLLDYLIEDDAISTEVYARIKAEKRPHEQAREFLDHVSSVGEKAFLSYKRGLKETKCDSLMQAIDAGEEERKKQRRIAEETKCKQRASWPAPTPSDLPSSRQKLRSVKSLATYFERSDTSSHSERYTGRVSKDDGHSASESAFRSADTHASAKPFKGVKHVQQRFQSRGTIVAGSVACSTTLDLSEDDAVPDTTTVKQVANSLNDLNIGLNTSSVCSNTPQIKPVNMLLVGCKENGKSSTGNSILGEKCFMSKRRGGTSKSSLRSGCFQGESEDVQWDVNVVDTPGISPEMSRSEFEEIVRGVKMLSGLDAIVLIWSYDHTDRNAEVEMQAFKSLHRLFGDALYKYLVIVVTNACRLTSVEEYVQELPEPLREIARKCSGRLVTFENDVSNVEEIQGSREDLCNIVYSLTSNRNHHRYTTVDLSPLCTISEGSELRLALMGKTGVGKSSTGNSIIGCEKFAISCLASSQTFDCPYHTRTKPRKVAVVDTPGVLCTDVVDKDRLADQLSSIPVIYNKEGLHAMLLVISGRQRFTQEDKNTVEDLQAVFGDRLLKQYTVIVITGRDEIEGDRKVRGDVKTYLQNAPNDLQEVLKLCNRRVVFFNNKTKDETIQRMQLAELIRMIDDLVERNGGPYIDENFEEGEAVASDIEARSKQNYPLSSKAKSTSQLPTTSSRSASFPPDGEQQQPLPTRARSISGPGIPIGSISSTSPSFHDQSSEERIGLPGVTTASDDETFTTDELVPVRNKTPVSVAEDQPRAAYNWRSQKSLEEFDKRARASFSPREKGETSLRYSEDSTAAEAEERVRRFTALSNLRLTKLWRAIRKKLRFGRRKRYTVTVAPSTKECWTGL